MASDANGILVVPVWSDDGVGKPLVNDVGQVPVAVDGGSGTIDVNIKSSDIDVPVTIDAATIDVPVSIDAATIDVPVEVDAAVSSIQGQAYGWDTAAWHKLAMLWGFTGPVYQSQTAVSTGATFWAVYCPVAPAGYVYVMTGYAVAHNCGVARDVQIRVTYAGTSYIFEIQAGLGSGLWRGGHIHAVLAPGAQLSVGTTATAAGQNLWVQAIGYSMKINE